MNSNNLKSRLIELGADKPIIDILKELKDVLPSDTNVESDVWDILDWDVYKRNSKKRTISFECIKHDDLKLICKIWLLHNRLIKKNSSTAGFKNKIIVFNALYDVLGPRKLESLKTDDFYSAEKLLLNAYEKSTVFRYANDLQMASRWLSVNFNLRVDYYNRLPNPAVHGRYGKEDGREEKLIPTELIRDILNARHNEDLLKKDRFFISVFAIAVGTGFRIGEISTLPAECILKIDSKLHLLHFPKKGGKPVPRPIHPMLSDLIEDAVNAIKEETNEARTLAKLSIGESRLDWSGIISDDEAFRYFTEKWAHDWTDNPNHKMINPDGAWYNNGKRFIDAIGAYTEAGYNKVKAAKKLGITRELLAILIKAQEASRRGELPVVINLKNKGEGRTSWDTDFRMISFTKLSQFCNTVLNQKRRDTVKDIIDNAQNLQLKGDVYPAPRLNKTLERKYKLTSTPLVKDKNGNVLLQKHEALLLTHKYALSEQRGTKKDEFTFITEGQISRWLCGEKRSLGTFNSEDSVFNRLKIVDSRTGQFAKFTTHDIRHWLNTIYQNGGLTEDQIALIFNRKYKKQNATYDQTSNKVRTERLKQAVRDKVAFGQVADSYSTLADFSREDAEEYLTAVLRMANPMPHGVCMLNWATTPCPHHLSCFSCNDEKTCEHLIIDPTNEPTTKELNRLLKESQLVVDAIRSQGVEDSPSIHHFKRINRNVKSLLVDVKSVIEKNELNK